MTSAIVVCAENQSVYLLLTYTGSYFVYCLTCVSRSKGIYWHASLSIARQGLFYTTNWQIVISQWIAFVEVNWKLQHLACFVSIITNGNFYFKKKHDCFNSNLDTDYRKRKPTNYANLQTHFSCNAYSINHDYYQIINMINKDFVSTSHMLKPTWLTQNS